MCGSLCFGIGCVHGSVSGSLSRRRLFWEVVSRLIRKGLHPEGLAGHIGFSNMFLQLPKGYDLDGIEDRIRREWPGDSSAVQRYDFRSDRLISFEDNVYVLRNQSSGIYLPKLVDMAREKGITWDVAP